LIATPKNADIFSAHPDCQPNGRIDEPLFTSRHSIWHDPRSVFIRADLWAQWPLPIWAFMIYSHLRPLAFIRGSAFFFKESALRAASPYLR
jgi:hypothetical protein